jgi:hypothetical protein
VKGQARQALDIYRARDMGMWVDTARPARSIAELAVRWWRPSISQAELERRRARRKRSCGAEWVALHPLTRANDQFPLGLVAVVALIAVGLWLWA